jgi:hypothetical protein
MIDLPETARLDMQAASLQGWKDVTARSHVHFGLELTGVNPRGPRSFVTGENLRMKIPYFTAEPARAMELISSLVGKGFTFSLTLEGGLYLAFFEHPTLPLSAMGSHAEEAVAIVKAFIAAGAATSP